MKSVTEDSVNKRTEGVFGDYVRHEPRIEGEKANETGRGAHQGKQDSTNKLIKVGDDGAL